MRLWVECGGDVVATVFEHVFGDVVFFKFAEYLVAEKSAVAG